MENPLTFVLPHVHRRGQGNAAGPKGCVYVRISAGASCLKGILADVVPAARYKPVHKPARA